MQAIILAAGMGSRMGELTKDEAKPMVLLNNRPLISLALDNLSLNNIQQVIIVVGYKGEKIKNHVGKIYKGMQIRYVENQEYESKNNIYSIWLCKEYLLREDSIIIEGDVIFDADIIEKINNENDNVIAIAPFASWMNGTIIEVENNSFPIFTKMDMANVTSKKFKTINIYQ